MRPVSRCWQPFEESASASATAVTPRKPEPPLMRILLVEDDSKFGAYLEEGLRREGFLVDWARDGAEGVELAQGGLYDLILLDFMLPNKDGLQVAEDVRRLGQSMPILMLTARDSAE